MTLEGCGQLLPSNGWFAMFVEIDEQGRGYGIMRRLIAWAEVIRQVKSDIGVYTEVKELAGIYNSFKNGPTLVYDDPLFVRYEYKPPCADLPIDLINRIVHKVKGDMNRDGKEHNNPT